MAKLIVAPVESTQSVSSTEETNLNLENTSDLNIIDDTPVITTVVTPIAGLAKIKAASIAAEAIVASFTGHVTEDAVAKRSEELMNKTPAELIAIILGLEKPKTKDGLTVEVVARKFMECKELGMFTWPQIALLVKRVLPEANTSSKSIASYASKRKDIWAIAPREKFSLSGDDMMALANNQ